MPEVLLILLMLLGNDPACKATEAEFLVWATQDKASLRLVLYQRDRCGLSAPLVSSQPRPFLRTS